MIFSKRDGGDDGDPDPRRDTVRQPRPLPRPRAGRGLGHVGHPRLGGGRAAGLRPPRGGRVGMLDLAYYAVLDHGPRVMAALALASWYGTVAAVLMGNPGPYRD